MGRAPAAVACDRAAAPRRLERRPAGALGSHLAVAADGDRARLVVGAGGPLAAYAASAGRGPTPLCGFGTHAATVALLVHGRVAVDPAQLPVLLALGASLGADTHVAGVRALELATVVDLPPAGPPVERSFWPRRERWASVPPAEADGLAHAALLDAVERRVGAEPAPALALTAGRDSPVVAAACREAGLTPDTFTFGETDWPDVVGAQRIARAFGLPHVHLPLGAIADDAALRQETLRDALWSDGLAAVGPQGAPALPDPMSALVTGAGAEVARCYSYQAVARERRRPRPEHLLATLDLPGRMTASGPDHEQAARARVLAWLEEAATLAHGGWAPLDVLYTEQRVARWGTARLPRQTDACAVVPFGDPDLARATLSLPLADRLALGFHRRTIARVAPAVAQGLPPMQTQRPGLPAPLRRARRRRREQANAAQRAQPAPFLFKAPWLARPDLVTWIADDLLADARLTDWLGDGWGAALRDGFRTWDARHVERALLLAGLVVWARRVEPA